MFEITLKFLQAVQINNNTQRFHTHYDLYQQERKRFSRFMERILNVGKTLNPQWTDVDIKKCIFRFNRDVRYRVDKSPYKDHFGAEIAVNGKRSDYPCFYFELRPGASFVGVGTWRSDASFENKMRKYAIINFEKWKKLQQKSDFSQFFGEMTRNHPDEPAFIGEYKSMYCLKKALPDGDAAIEKLSDEWKSLRTSKCSYHRAIDLISNFPKKDHKYYYQLCFMKDWLWQVKVPDELLTDEEGLFVFLEKALKTAMPMILFLQEGCDS